MRITFEVDDKYVASLEQFLLTQVKVENDPVTKAQRFTKMHANVPAFLHDALHQVVHQVVMQYPPDDVRAQMEAAARIQEDLKAAVKPRIITGA